MGCGASTNNDQVRVFEEDSQIDPSEYLPNGEYWTLEDKPNIECKTECRQTDIPPAFYSQPSDPQPKIYPEPLDVQPTNYRQQNDPKPTRGHQPEEVRQKQQDDHPDAEYWKALRQAYDEKLSNLNEHLGHVQRLNAELVSMQMELRDAPIECTAVQSFHVGPDKEMPIVTELSDTNDISARLQMIRDKNGGSVRQPKSGKVASAQVRQTGLGCAVTSRSRSTPRRRPGQAWPDSPKKQNSSGPRGTKSSAHRETSPSEKKPPPVGRMLNAEDPVDKVFLMQMRLERLIPR